jgi:hypoxanthine-DNA glycosylase
MTSNARLACFAPIINRSSKVLILGSMPSVRSLKLQQYYGHPQNQFWKIIAALFDVAEWKDYGHKKRVILGHKIALWDVIDSCERAGSADANIKEARVSDLHGLLKKYPNIQVVFCDSGTAFKLLMRYCPDLPRPVFQLPSPSPAYTIPYQTKLKQWKAVLKWL